MSSDKINPFVLTTDLLRFAYAQGYFPMPDQTTEEILWYHPDPRAIIPLDGFYYSRSLERSIRNRGYKVSYNRAFAEVMHGCANRKETWINAEFLRVYKELHQEGSAHSVEIWQGDALVGGLYGVSIRGAFFAESKFHTERDASKVALHYLIERMKKKNMSLLEVQFMTPHLKKLGAIEIAADDYKERLSAALLQETRF